MILAPFLLFLALLEKGKSALIVHLGVVQGTCNFEIVGSKFQDLGLTQIGKEKLFGRTSTVSEGRQNVLERHCKSGSPRQLAQGASNLDGHPVGSLR